MIFEIALYKDNEHKVLVTKTMAKTYKLVVKRLPRKVCVSIRAMKGRTLTKRKNVKYGRKRRKSKSRRKRKMKYQTFIKKCMKRHKGRKYGAKSGKMGMCARRYKRGLRP